MTAGAVFPPECRTDRDLQTGCAVTQLTNSPEEDYHPYFYNPAVTRDGRYLIFFSERTGLSNLFRLDLLSGEIVQLTDVRPARAEYWPFTTAVRGAGACLAAIRKRMTQAGAHFVVDVQAECEAVIDEIDRRLASGERP